MKLLNEIKSKAKLLKKELTALYYAYNNPKLPLLPKIIIIVTLAYALSPIDLIPDFIPVLGYLDDLLIVPALITLSIKLIPEEIMNQARTRANEEPLKLNKNWLTAIIFILIWVILLIVIFKAVLSSFTRNNGR